MQKNMQLKICDCSNMQLKICIKYAKINKICRNMLHKYAK